MPRHHDLLAFPDFGAELGVRVLEDMLAEFRLGDACSQGWAGRQLEEKNVSSAQPG
jgi:hypothetical protein